MVSTDFYPAVFPDCLVSIFDDIDQNLFKLDAVYVDILIIKTILYFFAGIRCWSVNTPNGPAHSGRSGKKSVRECG